MAETALWNLIRDVRTRAGLNPRELARQLKMSPAHLYQIEDEKSGQDDMTMAAPVVTSKTANTTTNDVF